MLLRVFSKRCITCLRVSSCAQRGVSLQHQQGFCSDSKDDNDGKKSVLDLAAPKMAKLRRDSKLKQEKSSDATEHNVHPKLVEATHKVADSLNGDKEQITGDLLRKLKEKSQPAQKQKNSWPTISALLNEMEFDESSQQKPRQPPRNPRQMPHRDGNEGLSGEPRKRPGEADRQRMDQLHKERRFQQKPGSLLQEKAYELSQQKPRQPPRNQRQMPQTRDRGPPGEPHKRPGEVDGRRSPLMNQQQKDRRIQQKSRQLLWSSNGLGIFTEPVKTDSLDTKEQSLFDKLEEKERILLHTYPPSNAFEEEIEWTKQGKIWTFPVDNEEGMEEEAEVGFYQHVFLEDQLQGFPEKGPVRYFMDLVITGLSQNPYLTIQQKTEHINWFRDYFSNKLQQIEEGTASNTAVEQS